MSLLQQKNNWLIVLLVLLNIGTLTSIWLRGQPGGPPPRLGQIFQQELGLSDEQASQFEDLARQHRQQMERFDTQLRAENQRLFGALGQPTPDSTAAAAAIDSLTAARRQMETTRARFFLELKALCTPDQQARLAEVFARVVRRPPPPRGGR